jgi:hypothetical protein
MRERLVAACRAIEALPEHAGATVREDLTGPIVDLLHRDAGVVSKELANGLVLKFLYPSRIARDFVLSVPDKPDHVWEPQTTKLVLHLVFEVHRAHVDWSDGLDATEILRHLAGLGYSAYAVRDFQSNRDLGGRPIELVPPETAHLEGPPHGFNVLATKDRGLIEKGPFVLSPGVSPKLLLHRDPALHHPAGGL